MGLVDEAEPSVMDWPFVYLLFAIVERTLLVTAVDGRTDMLVLAWLCPS